MINVSDEFTANSTSEERNIIAKLEIDWDLDGTYTDETSYAVSLEIERNLSLPLGGVSLAMADVTLTNETDRFTPVPVNP